jgi:hypothetical protein
MQYVPTLFSKQKQAEKQDLHGMTASGLPSVKAAASAAVEA